MSKLGKAPIKLPENIKVTQDDVQVSIVGPKGTLKVNKIKGVSILVKDDEVVVTLDSTDLENGSAYWGLIRSLINNAVIGVSEGYSKELELVGIGYRVAKSGNKLNFQVGYSHPVEIEAPDGIELDVEGNNIVKVTGIDKQLVGQVAADIRSIKKPEPYKGKGIRYKGEIVKRKPGKAAKTVV